MTMKTSMLLLVVLTVLLAMASPLLAADGVPTSVSLAGGAAGAGIGAGLILMGAGYGFGRIGAAGLESMARQPDKLAQIQIAMIIIAALLEGAILLGLLLITLPLVGKAGAY
jgi:F-type H+-transporting ATPase subunit c